LVVWWSFRFFGQLCEQLCCAAAARGRSRRQHALCIGGDISRDWPTSQGVKARFDSVLVYTAVRIYIDVCLVRDWPSPDLPACIYGAGISRSITDAFISSGSALSTLGFHTPASSGGQILSIVEGTIGLIGMVYLVMFMPAVLAFTR
jgi:hypothetical protein